MTCATLLLTLALAAGAAGTPGAPATVLLISVDGLHPDALAKAPMARLERLMARGQWTLLGRSTVPPKTLIAHSSMLTGMLPEVNGKTDNDWEPGDSTVEVRTLFHVAKAAGYRTGFFYSKPKLGYLVSAAVDVHVLAPDDGIERTRRLLSSGGRAFVFLHVSGLEFVGMKSGWMSADYLARARAIDAALTPLLDAVEARGQYLLVVTSDHAGHEREHGTEHPEDGLRPVILASDVRRFPEVQGKPQEITALASIISRAMGPKAR